MSGKGRSINQKESWVVLIMHGCALEHTALVGKMLTSCPPMLYKDSCGKSRIMMFGLISVLLYRSFSFGMI